MEKQIEILCARYESNPLGRCKIRILSAQGLGPTNTLIIYYAGVRRAAFMIGEDIKWDMIME